MDDKEIVQLYFNRDESAIAQTQIKYESYCYTIAFNVLQNVDDAKECINDTYMQAWNSIPPNRPANLSFYLGKIARNLSFDKYRKNHAQKRGNGEMAVVLDELSECLSSSETVESKVERKELLDAINSFLSEIPKEQSRIFLLRYWYAMPINMIALKCGITSTNVSTQLSRIRKSLKEYLIKSGFEI